MAERIRTRFLVVGSGVAGLHTAWRASADDDVLVLTKRSLFDSATAYAQGGIAGILSQRVQPSLRRKQSRSSSKKVPRVFASWRPQVRSSIWSREGISNSVARLLTHAGE
ncbi:MAG: hypothetical protein DMD72_04070 [Gemmatimonadetes bacterium]|nr:MAG: hypothetical protein DMD72_04070 [Gemmatimonadota bacterium]